MEKFIRISLNIGLNTLSFGDTVTQSKHFVQIINEILKNRVFCVLCKPYITIIREEPSPVTSVINENVREK